ncbi:Gfo/Idh/MocA family oxidoreductase [bacterium]|nr:Gfo/Idh/MocA family oxidoreductase [bacterium]
MSKLRHAVVGVKGVGRGHLNSIRQAPDAELVAVCDLDREAVERVARDLNARPFTDYRALLSAGGIDSVSLCVPHGLHAPMTLEALDAGLHVLVEKPIANTVAEADRVVEKARAKGLTVATGHQYRTFKAARTMKRLIEEGEVGAIYRVLWTWLELRPESYYARDVWRCTWKGAGGGVLMNQTSHDLDLICWLAGDPVEVSGMIGNWGHAAEIEDFVCATVRFANDALGSIQLSTITPRGLSLRQISGDRGTVDVRDVRSLASDADDEVRLGRHSPPVQSCIQNAGAITAQAETRWETVPYAPGEGGHATLVRDFVSAARNGRDPLVPPEEARRVVELINAIVLSSFTRRTVRLPVDREEYGELFRRLCGGEAQTPRYR